MIVGKVTKAREQILTYVMGFNNDDENVSSHL